MKTAVQVGHLEIFPIKSLTGLSLPSAELLPAGPFKNDRRWSLLDQQGKFVNGKRLAAVHRIQARFDPDISQLQLTIAAENPPAATHLFHWPGEQQEVAELLTEYLQLVVHFAEAADEGFPDDTLSSGPTIIGSATLDKLTEWFPEISADEFRRRFRSNIVLQTTEPFWEDRLFGSAEQPRKFWIGEVPFWGVNPCQRCVVPARNSLTGEITSGFQKIFAARRQAEFPDHLSREQFNHYYRLAVNTRLVRAEPGQVISLGDDIRLEE